MRLSKLVRPLLLIAAAGVAGQVVSRRMSRGDENSDEFMLAAIFGGQAMESTASALRQASVLAVMGGVSLDLRRATLDPAGATLDITTVMGGVEVKVPTGWTVDVEQHGKAGGVDVQVTETAEGPSDDAPTLTVAINTWFGGVAIRDEPGSAPLEAAPAT